MPKKVSKEDGLDKLLSEGLINKGNDKSFEYSRIPFDIEPLDNLTGGGIPTKRLTLITGPSNTGKSYLCLRLAKSVQERGGNVAWIDAEWSWDHEWAEKCGVNTENIMVSQPEGGEKTFEIIRELMRSGEINLIVLDSIAALIPTVFSTEGMTYNPVAIRARLVNDGLSRLLPNLRKGTALVFINQLRSGIGPYALDVYPGGEGQSFFAHIILQLRREGWIEETVDGKKKRVGFDIEVRQRKSKVKGASYDSCVVPFRLEGGIDFIEIIIGELLEKEIVKKAGMWYSLDDGTKLQGRDGLKEYFLKNPEILEKFKEMV